MKCQGGGGGANPPSTKIYLSNFEYKILNKHVDYSDQHWGAVHPILCNKDVKVMKICTIILISMMTLALKVIAMFTLSMGTLILECYLQTWMNASPCGTGDRGFNTVGKNQENKRFLSNFVYIF